MTTSQQPEFSFRAGRAASRVEAAEVRLLVKVLHGKGWLKAAEVIEAVWAESNGAIRWHDRKVRAVAASSGGAVASWPGSPGYKLTLDCTPAEIERARGLRNQGREMIRHFIRISKVWHGSLRPAIGGRE